MVLAHTVCSMLMVGELLAMTELATGHFIVCSVKKQYFFCKILKEFFPERYKYSTYHSSYQLYVLSPQGGAIFYIISLYLDHYDVL